MVFHKGRFKLTPPHSFNMSLELCVNKLTGASASVLLSAVLYSLLAARSTEVQEMGHSGGLA